MYTKIGETITLKLNLEDLSTWDKAKQAFINSDNTPHWIWSGLDEITYNPPTDSEIEVEIVNPGATTPKQRQDLVKEMETKGFRPMEFSELIAFGIQEKELIKSESLVWYNTLKEYPLGGDLQAPCLDWDGDVRKLNAGGISDDWDGRGRFLFVRKSLALSPSSSLDTLTLAIETCKQAGLTVSKVY